MSEQDDFERRMHEHELLPRALLALVLARGSLLLELVSAVRAWDAAVTEGKPQPARDGAKDRVAAAAKRVAAELLKSAPPDVEELLRAHEERRARAR